MNVFEDLIVELKEENLLEETIFDTPGVEFDEVIDTPHEEDNEPAIVRNDEVLDDDTKPKKGRPEKANREFFKKRAVAEVSSLQMVEHVLTSVEREYMKVKPNEFDDFNVKKALNNFLQAADSDTDEQKSAEFELMQQTQAWHAALAARDNVISVPNLRLFCENTRPALSSQALLALARFYRNSPYSEPVRSKFDFVITRLFSRSIGGEKRKPLFSREDALGHIYTLYGEWSSIPLYTADDDESRVELTAMSFDDLTREANRAERFDDLIESDFFGRLRLFKESISELFFAPEVAVAAIEANIAIGNAYVKLIDKEREKMDADHIQSKYGDLDSANISDAAGRTLELVGILRGKPSVEEEFVEEEDEHDEHDPTLEKIILDAPAPKKEVEQKTKLRLPAFLKGLTENIFQVNRWLLVVSAILISASVGLYVWANYFAEQPVSTSGVQSVNLDNAIYREHLKSAKIASETFYGVLLPSWDTLPKEKREEYIKKILQAGPSSGFKQVSLMRSDGKNAGYASASRVDIPSQ